MRKYRLLYSPGSGRKPGPKVPFREVIDAIVEMKRRDAVPRNPRYGCPRIAQQINLAFGLHLDKDIVRRVLLSHPFVERPIASVRRELLDQTLFWTATDLDNKLRNYQRYFNECRTHSGRDGVTPVETSGNTVVDINRYRWKKLCRGLFQLPVAA